MFEAAKVRRCEVNILNCQFQSIDNHGGNETSDLSYHCQQRSGPSPKRLNIVASPLGEQECPLRRPGRVYCSLRSKMRYYGGESLRKEIRLLPGYADAIFAGPRHKHHVHSPHRSTSSDPEADPNHTY